MVGSPCGYSTSFCNALAEYLREVVEFVHTDGQTRWSIILHSCEGYSTRLTFGNPLNNNKQQLLDWVESIEYCDASAFALDASQLCKQKKVYFLFCFVLFCFFVCDFKVS